jgi:hypothetical protein
MFSGPDRQRRSLWIGKVSMRQAETLRVLIEELLKAARTGNAPDEVVSMKVNSLHATIREKLVRFGLIDAPNRPEAVPLGRFITGYVKHRTKAKPATKEIWRQGELSLLAFFGPDRLLDSVTPGDADEYLEYLGLIQANLDLRDPR